MQCFSSIDQKYLVKKASVITSPSNTQEIISSADLILKNGVLKPQRSQNISPKKYTFSSKGDHGLLSGTQEGSMKQKMEYIYKDTTQD